MTRRLLSNIFLLLGVVIALLLSGCATPKNVAYIQDITQETFIPNVPQQIKIKPNDKLSIVVNSLDPSVTDMFNLPALTQRIGDNSSSSTPKGTMNTHYNVGLSVYTVNPDGNIDFPVLGDIHVAGMTKNELSYFIKGELIGKNLVKDPIVTVEFINMGVSVLGEVTAPGLYDITQDGLNILEVLAMAGDLTINGQRENVALIREEADGIHAYRLDLTNLKELTESPVFFLKQGDIIYVEPNNFKKRSTTTNGNSALSASFWISVASLLATLLTSVAVFVR